MKASEDSDKPMYKAIIFDVSLSIRGTQTALIHILDRGCGDAEPLPCHCGIRANVWPACQLPQWFHVEIIPSICTDFPDAI